jgi:single-strand DNA-binding protein
MNRICLVGRAVRQPELRVTPGGTSVTTFATAVDRQRKVEGGDNVDFIDCVCFGKLAEIVSQYVDKGKLVAVEGRLESRKWEAKDGGKRVAWEVICDNVQFLSRGDEQRE